MKHLLIIFSLLLTSVSWSKDVDWNNLVKRDGLYYEKFNDIPFTGNSIGQGQGKIKDGKQVGKWLRYYGNGQLASKLNFKNGKYEGEQLNYYENGQLHMKTNWKDGKREGKWLIYYENGKLETEWNFKDGKLILGR